MKLVPVKRAQTRKEIDDLIAEIKRTRKGTSLCGLSIRQLVNEGRKY